LQIRDQLNRQQRKSFLPLSAQKPGNGNPLLFKLRKQLDSIPKVGGNRSVAISIAADRTLWTNNGEKIDMAGQKRFFIFENRFNSVIVRQLNFSALWLSRGQASGGSDLWACLLGALGYFKQVNFLPPYFRISFIIGYGTLQTLTPSSAHKKW
jgi:hypothetical protein